MSRPEMKWSVGRTGKHQHHNATDSNQLYSRPSAPRLTLAHSLAQWVNPKPSPLGSGWLCTEHLSVYTANQDLRGLEIRTSKYKCAAIELDTQAIVLVSGRR